MPSKSASLTDRGIIFVSLGSPVMTAEYLSNVILVSGAFCVELEICLLAEPEVINLVTLHKYFEADARNQVKGHCDGLTKALRRDCRDGNVSIRTWGYYDCSSHFTHYVRLLSEQFQASRSFRNHCRNQVFTSLQPVLRNHGAFKKTHPLTGVLAQYLIEEMALKLYVASQELANVEFGPRAEMDLVNAIYDGKYPALEELTRRRMRYIVVSPKKNSDE